MTLFSLLAVAYTFTATATGIEKGTPVEFFFAGEGTDRDYETMFVLEGSVGDFCKGIEQAGIPRGKPADASLCDLWPVGCTVEISPSMADFVETTMPEGLSLAPAIYTGGTRAADGTCMASENMPLAAFCLYSLPQSPIVFNGTYPQGDVYKAHVARVTLKKGEKVRFTLNWNGKPLAKHLELEARPGNSRALIETLRDESANGEVEARVDFSPELTVAEAVALAKSLRTIDSTAVKINGFHKGRLYYGAFLPLVSWTDRRERLTQPLELTIGDPDKLVFINEDWSGEGSDPKLTPQEISFQDAAKHSTDTCFVYVAASNRLEKVYAAMSRLAVSNVCTWYVYARE